MKQWVSFFLDRPVLVKVIIAAIFLVGLKTVRDIPKEGFPNISLNTMIITTIYPGASARDVEQNITIPIEEELLEVAGIDELTSVSKEGMSMVTVKVDEDVDDDQFFDVYTKVDAALNNVNGLPGDVEGRPTIKTLTTSDFPVIEVAVNGEYEKLLSFVPRLAKKIRVLSNVSAVNTIGLPDQEVHILVDPKKARDQYVDLPMISGAIARRNVEATGGTLETPESEKKIVSLNKYQNDQDVLETNIRMNDDGSGVKLKDIATLSYEPEDIRLKVRNNGEPGVVLSVTKKSGTDIIATVEQIEEIINNFPSEEGVELKVISNSSTFTKARLSLTVNNAIIGFILVVFILFLFFDFRSAFWTAFGIPLCLFGAYAVFPFFDLTLNLISMGGFIVVLGLMVDDAIVVSEQINLYKEKGYTGKEAATLAVSRVWKAVLAGVGTTILAFTPMFSIGGMPGKFIWVLPFVVIIILIFSLFDAYFILPSHLMEGDGAKKKEKKKFVIKLEEVYAHYLNIALDNKKKVIVIFVILLMGTMFVAKGIKKDPFPQESAEIFYAKIKFPVGTPYKITEEGIKKIEKIILDLKPNELLGFSFRIGTHNTGFTVERGTQNNIAAALVNLQPYSKRDRTAQEIVDDIRVKTKEVFKNENVEVNYEIKRIGPPMGFAIEVHIASSSDQNRYQQAKDIKEFLLKQPGVSDVVDDDIEGKDEYNIKIDYDALDRAGLTVQDVVLTLKTAFDGRKVTSVTTHIQSQDFRLRLNKDARGDIDFIKSLPLINKRGQLIKLDKMVTIETLASKGEIIHRDGKRTLTVKANVDKKLIQPAQIVQAIKENFVADKGTEITFGGETVEGGKMFADLGVAFIVAIIAIYLAITLTFSSFSVPLLIMSIIPFGLTGIVFASFIHGLPISMFSMLAVIGLTGVIVNDSIVMVDMIQSQIKEKGFSKESLIEGAVVRLRPILLTTLTTILALFPTGYGFGGYDPFLSHMCLALSFGLMFGTFLLLFLLPTLYFTAGKLRRSFGHSMDH